MAAMSVALERYRRRAQRARALERQAAALWQQVDRADIGGSWSALMPQLLATLTAVQQAEAAEADAYVALAMAEQSQAVPAADRIVPEALSAIASDGRALDTLLMQPVITARTALAAGRSIDTAMSAGQAVLQMIASTQATDAGRIADQTAMVTHHAQGYVRMVGAGACSRCAILAGKWYRWNAGFDRHPNCTCVGIPAREDRHGDFRTDPQAYFRHLSHGEQDRIFGRAGAQAIRDGADMSQVVNARSGMYTAGGEARTRAGTSRRALYGGYRLDANGNLVRRSLGERTAPRLMPEQIFKQALGDRERAMQLLREYGYITPGSTLARAGVEASSFASRLAAAATEQDARAAATLSRLRTRDRLSDAELRALYDYTGMTYGELNRPLRTGLGSLTGIDAAARADIRLIDAAMSRSPLTVDVELYRGLGNGSRAFGDYWESNLTGAEWIEHAYLSASSSAREAARFSTAGGAQMRLLVPRGVRGIELTDDTAEAEVLLQRGLRLRVISDTGPGSRPRVIDVEVIP